MNSRRGSSCSCIAQLPRSTPLACFAKYATLVPCTAIPPPHHLTTPQRAPTSYSAAENTHQKHSTQASA